MSNLRRVKIDVVQGWRGIAACLIVVVHVFLRFDYVSTSQERGFLVGEFLDLSFLELGVDVFFLISGFIVVYISEQVGSKLVFFAKRLLRIYPPYWIYSALMVFVLFCLSPSDRRLDFNIEELFRAAALYPTINPLTKNIFPLFLSQGWTLMYELLFYIIFAMFIGFNRWYRVVFTSLILLAVHLLACFTGLFAGAVQWMFSDSVMLEFVGGMLLGVIYLNGWLRVSGAWALAIFALGFSLLLYFQFNPYEGWGRRLLIYCLPMVFMFYSSLFWKRSENIRIPAFLMFLGNASYSIYLTHTIVILVLARLNNNQRILSKVSLDVQFFATITICVVVGLVLYAFIEKPVLRVSSVIIKNMRNTLRLQS